METSNILKIIGEVTHLCMSDIWDAREKTLTKLHDYSNKKQTFPFTCAQQLYHYCSLETFYSIIESNCFWLSHPKFMNDVSEAKYFIKKSLQFLKEYDAQNYKDDNFQKLLELVDLKINQYESSSRGFDDDEYKKLNFFICFSSDGNSLPMWNTYRGKNIGLSLGLDFTDEKYFIKVPVMSGKNIKEEALSPFIGVPHYCFSDIEYDTNKISEAVHYFLDLIRESYNTRIKTFNEQREYIDDIYSTETYATLINLTTNLKDSNFNYEKETRFILNKYESEDIKFRIRDKFIVPYIEFPLEEKTVEDENKGKIKIKQKFNKPIIPIKSITISPNAEEPELVKASIWAFLNHKGYKIKREDIKQSTIPFKPR